MSGLKRLAENRKYAGGVLVKLVGTRNKVRITERTRRIMKKVDQAKRDMEGRARTTRIG